MSDHANWIIASHNEGDAGRNREENVREMALGVFHERRHTHGTIEVDRFSEPFIKFRQTRETWESATALYRG